MRVSPRPRQHIVLIALCVSAVAIDAQEKAPKRPKLPATADTSDPLAHYRYALSVIERDARAADAALYWALRLAPSWAEALYARRVAVLRSDERRLLRYMKGDRGTARELRWADSLMFRSRLLAPFAYQDLDRGLVHHFLRSVIAEDLRRSGYNSASAELRNEIEMHVDRMLSTQANVALRAWIAFSNRELDEAARLYGALIGKKANPDVREDRATALYLAQRYDSAAGELEKAIAEFADRDRKEEIALYRPKALLYYKLGIARVKLNNLAAAKEAFAKALEEDLSFYPAHISIANHALTENDTATAVRELDLAVQLGPNEVMPYMRYAELLIGIGRGADAVPSLKQVVEREPYYAEPRLRLARILDRQGEKAGALEHYNAFLRLAARSHEGRPEALERVSALGGTSGD